MSSFKANAVQRGHSLSPNQNSAEETEQTQEKNVQENTPHSRFFDPYPGSWLDANSVDSSSPPRNPTKIQEDNDVENSGPPCSPPWWMSPELEERLDLCWSSTSHTNFGGEGETGREEGLSSAAPAVQRQIPLPSSSSLSSGMPQLKARGERQIIRSSLSGRTMGMTQREAMTRLEHILHNRLLRISRVDRRNRQEAQSERRRKMRLDRLRSKMKAETELERSVEKMQGLAIEYDTRYLKPADGLCTGLQRLNLQQVQRNENEESKTWQKEEDGT
jgi:hypothetical protein